MHLRNTVMQMVKIRTMRGLASMSPSFPIAETWTWWVGWGGSIEMGLSCIALGGRDCGHLPDNFNHVRN